MKKVIKGKKRFTQVVSIIKENNDDYITYIDECFKLICGGHVRQNKDGTKTYGLTIEEELKEWMNHEKQWLTDLGHPCEDKVYEIPNGKDTKGKPIYQYSNKMPEGIGKIGFLPLTNYFSDVKGYDLGSLEYLSARIIMTITSLMKTDLQKPEDRIYRWFYELGKIKQIRDVYHQYSLDMKSVSSNEKSLITEHIKILAKREGTPKELWSKLQSMLDNADMEFEIEGSRTNQVIKYEKYDKKEGKYIEKSLTYKNFSNQLRNFRNKKS